MLKDNILLIEYNPHWKVFTRELDISSTLEMLKTHYSETYLVLFLTIRPEVHGLYYLPLHLHPF